MKKRYLPRPIDTTQVVLDEPLSELIELLARNTHEIWASQRIADGWTYGKERNDLLKEHPGLVPYEELSESEKEYDRNTAAGVIKTLLTLNYTITKNPSNPTQPKDK